MSAARVAVESTQEGSFYSCLFFPVQGWFFMPPIPLSDPKSEATVILLRKLMLLIVLRHKYWRKQKN